MSQERLAERAGVNYKHIGRIELAKTEPGADVLLRIARALAVPIGTLFETVTKEPTPHRLSPADIEAISSALNTLNTVLNRVLTRQPHPLPPRAPRQPRR
jgi:transcriptional regulator with XRE-family HTH domain